MLAVVASLAHNQEVIGSNPIPAPIAYRQGVINAAVHSPQMGGKHKLMLG